MPEWTLYNVGDTIECLHTLGKVDASTELLVNTGVHHNHDAPTIAANVHALLDWHRSVPVSQRPCVVWRETLPQHFRSPTGEIPLNPANGSALITMCAHKVAVAPTGSDSGTGAGPFSGVGCSPLSMDAAGKQQFNAAAEALLPEPSRDQRWGIARVYHEATPYWYEKVGCSGNGSAYSWPGTTGTKLDCTHITFLNSETHRVVICKALEAIRSACHTRIQASGTRDG